MKQVLIKPLFESGANNHLFENCYPWTFQMWRTRAAEQGIALDGWDTMPIERADCVWLLDLPASKRAFLEARKKARPEVPFVLQVMETPLLRPFTHHPENQSLCDYFVTYTQDLEARPNHFSYRLPHGFGGYVGEFTAYESRKCAIMVNHNKHHGFLGVREPGIYGLPGIGQNLGGWKVPFSSWVNPGRGELYSWRRRLARTAESFNDNVLDVVGPGWSGERLSWCRLVSHKPYKRCISRFVSGLEKLKLASQYKFCIAVENYRGNTDYISEKILDPMLCGSVPVYMGDMRIERVVPTSAFVDVRNFPSQRDLLKYLFSCPKQEWEDMIEAGKQFLNSESAQSFSSERYVETMNSILLHAMREGRQVGKTSNRGAVVSS